MRFLKLTAVGPQGDATLYVNPRDVHSFVEIDGLTEVAIPITGGAFRVRESAALILEMLHVQNVTHAPTAMGADEKKPRPDPGFALESSIPTPEVPLW